MPCALRVGVESRHWLLLYTTPKKEEKMKNPIVLIHGMMSDAELAWKDLKQSLQEKGYNVIALTLPFHTKGLSDKDRSNYCSYGLAAYVAHIQNEIRMHCLPKKPIVIGHSMGGWIAQKLATTKMVKKLILINPMPPKRLCYWSAGAVATFSEILLKAHVMTGGIWKISPEKMRYGFFNGIPTGVQEEMIDNSVHESGKAIFDSFNSLNPLGSLTLIDERHVRCPVLVQSGEEDKVIPTSISKKIAKKYGATFQQFKNGCHFMQRQPETVKNIGNEIHSWIRSN